MTSPFGRLVLIVNPRAGRNRVAQEMPEVERQLRAAGLEYRIVETTAAGHATEEARRALADGERFLVAVGGDGTVSEVVNGMIEDDRPVADDAVLGVVAAGSGCDFVRTFGLPGDAIRSVRHLTGERADRIDVVKATVREDGEERARYVANIAEAGFGGAVVRRAARLPRRLGRSRYFFGFWLEIRRYRPGDVRVTVDGRVWEGRANNVVVANCQFFGGGMRISPKSSPFDGMLDVLVSTGPKSQSFTMLPKIYRGEHLPHPNFVQMRARHVSVEADDPLPIEIDGEVAGASPAAFVVVPEVVALKL